jgi:serine/threonine-protein kinase
MDRRKYLGFVVFPAAIAAMLAFLFFVAKVDIFRSRTLEQSLQELATAEDSAIRWKAAADLKKRADPVAIPALRKALAEDKNPAVRMNAAAALASLATATAAVDIAPLLKDESSDVRRVAAFLLGELRSESARDPLRAALGDDHEPVRWNVAVALARLGDRAAIPTLHAMLRAPTPRSVGGAAQAVVPGAAAPAPEPDHDVHQSALLALAIVGGPESAKPIETFVEADVEPDLAPLAKEIVAKLKTRTIN